MIAIIQYNAGNIMSVKNALQRLGVDSIVTDNESDILSASKVIFPGVGEASSAMQYLENKNMRYFLKSITQPMLGICLGLQLMCKYSTEGEVDCLGIFDTKVQKFPNRDIIPHMGWNDFQIVKPSHITMNLPVDHNVYFAHSYYADVCKHTVAICNYILQFSAIMQKDNFYATQFHPEKSAGVGEVILKNFLNL